VIPVTEADVENAASGGGAYATLEVPADYRLMVTGVEDWKQEGKTMGWVYTLTISEEAGKGLTFKYFLSFEKERRSKMIRFFEAAGSPLAVGQNQTDPNEVVAAEAELGGRIDFPRKYYKALEEDGGTPGDAVTALGPIYREVRWVFPLTELEASEDTDSAEPAVAEVPTLE
jgi:hypothetical protein